MGHALELVRRCPEVTFVLDHIGKPDIKNGLVDPWRQQIRELAAHPNVVCKISGIITEAELTHSVGPWPTKQMRCTSCVGEESTSPPRILRILVRTPRAK
jgi:hypothetical protein